MANKIILIDGHSIMSRAFYGIPELTNAEGLHTNAIYGFLNILFKLLDQEEADHLTVAFDVHEPTFRHKMYNAYKGTRKPMPPELSEQIPVMQELLAAMRIPLLRKAGYEADDLLGTVAKRCQAEGAEVTIVSGDRDLLQLADTHIRICLPKTAKGVTTVYHYDPQDVEAEWHVTPQEFIDLKALMGDSSDNIPGVPGLGPKSAEWIIMHYHSIERAHEAAMSQDPEFKVPRKPKAAQLLIDEWESATLSKTLATIDVQAPIDFCYADAAVAGMFNEDALAMVRRLELKAILRRFEAAGISGSSAAAKEALPDMSSVKDVDDPYIARIAFRDAEKEGIAGFGIDGESLYFALQGERFYHFYGFDWKTELQTLARKPGVQLHTMQLKKAMHHCPFAPDSHVEDLSLAAYVIQPMRGSYDYAALAHDFLGWTLPPESELPAEKQANAGVCTAVVSLYSAGKIFDKLTELSEKELYENIERPLVYTLYDMERAGILVDQEALKSYGAELRAGIEVLEKRIYEEAGEQFNINSPKQLGEILFGKLGLRGGKKTKSGYSTAAEVLEKLAPAHPIVADVLQYRTLTKLNSTYAEGLLDCIQSDGRIHGEFQQMVTATGRISSTNPNLQNIPVRTELGRRFRRVFVPQPGHVFIDADYSQVELRILASLSGDAGLIAAYKDARDIHAVTASQVFHVPLDEVTPALRRNAKAVNFGIVYGISAFGLSEDLSISRSEAKEYIERYFAAYPDVKRYLDGEVDFAREHGYVKTLFGRRRPVPDIHASNFARRSFSERVAMNSPIQGTAADIMKKAMNEVHRALREGGYQARIVLQVHDELLIEAPEQEREDVQALLVDKMQHAVDLAVDLVADAKVGRNWDDAH